MKSKKFFTLLTTALSFSMLEAGNVYAKEVNLYEQPTANAKVVAKVDLSSGVIPIFTAKDGVWTKVGDPRNGNVGWLKSTDIKTNAISFTQRIVTDGAQPQTYQVFQFGVPTLSEKQIKTVNDNFLASQQNIQKAMQEMMHNMNDVFKQQMRLFEPPLAK